MLIIDLTIIDSTISTPKNLINRYKDTNLKRYMHNSVLSSSSYKSQEIETV